MEILLEQKKNQFGTYKLGFLALENNCPDTTLAMAFENLKVYNFLYKS
jgi:hypothetical protein